MPPRPTEVKAILALLEGPADNAEELAKRIITTLDEKRADRPEWIIVKAYRGMLVCAYRSFPTQRKAEDALSKLPLIGGEQYGTCRAWSMEHVDKAMKAADKPVRLKEVPRHHPTPYGPGEEDLRRQFGLKTPAQKQAEFRRRVRK